MPTIFEVIELNIGDTVMNKMKSLHLVKFQKDKETGNFNII